MQRVGFITHEDYLLHGPDFYHPENPMRLEAIYKGVDGADDLQPYLVRRKPAEPAPLELVEANHKASYIAFVEDACKKGRKLLDWGDTYINRDSYRAALLAVAGSVLAVDEVMAGEYPTAYCAIRPPGHHAEPDAAMGFCIFNNVAIAARYLIKKYGLERVWIFDFDVHHGNGTQKSFYSDGHVLYTSIHQFPHFPGTGARNETGEGTGRGLTQNIPLPSRATDDDYRAVIKDEILPKVQEYKPQAILLSAGYDGHKDDPLAGMQLSTEFYGEMVTMVREVAETHADGRIITFLEGGYDLDALAVTSVAHIRALVA